MAIPPRKIITAVKRDGDLTCHRCGSGTCRPFRKDCWVCGATIGGSGGNSASKAKVKTNDDDGDGCEHVLIMAESTQTFKKRPPATADTVLAGAAAAAAADDSLSQELGEPAADGPGISEDSSDEQLGKHILNGAMLSHVKAVVADQPLGSPAWRAMRTLLEQHTVAMAERDRRGLAAKAEAAGAADDTLEQALANREKYHAFVRAKVADNMKRRADEEAKWKETHDSERGDLQKLLDHAALQLKKFDEKATERAREWRASEDARAARLNAELKQAVTEMEKASTALKSAPRPNMTAAQVEELAKATSGDTSSSSTPPPANPTNDVNMMDDLVTASLTTNEIPLVPPPKLQPPTDAAALGRLQAAKAVLQF